MYSRATLTDNVRDWVVFHESGNDHHVFSMLDRWVVATRPSMDGNRSIKMFSSTLLEMKGKLQYREVWLLGVRLLSCTCLTKRAFSSRKWTSRTTFARSALCDQSDWKLTSGKQGGGSLGVAIRVLQKWTPLTYGNDCYCQRFIILKCLV